MPVTEEIAFHAQFGEDRILAEHFAGQMGYFVEVGAYDGVEYSNTCHFEKLGWSGLLVEADPELAEKCRKSRPRSAIANCAAVATGGPKEISFDVVEGHRGLSGVEVNMDFVRSLTGRSAEEIKIRRITVPALTLDEILEKNGGREISFMTIDVEGQEMPVLRGFTISRWKPGIVIMERNTPVPDKEILQYMHENGYQYGRTTGGNDWFFRVASGKADTLSYRAMMIRKFYGPHLMRSVWRGAKSRVKAGATLCGLRRAPAAAR